MDDQEAVIRSQEAIIQSQETDIRKLEGKLKNIPPPMLRMQAPPAPPPPRAPPPPPPPSKVGVKRVSNMFVTNLQARKGAGHDASELAKVARRYVGSDLTNDNIRRNYSPKYKWAIDSVAITNTERKKRGLPVNVVGEIIPKLNKTKPLSVADLLKYFEDVERTSRKTDILAELQARFAKRAAPRNA